MQGRGTVRMTHGGPRCERGAGGLRAWGAILPLALVALGCDDPPQEDEDTLRIGVILSYTGYLAASSINSERALLMAIETANQAGGIGNRRLRLLTRDTRSNATKAVETTRQLLETDPAVIIGPDTTDLITQIGPLLQNRTLILPSLSTSADVRWKAPSWFVMGPSLGRVACELVAQLKADGRTKPVVVVNPSGYNSELAWDLGNRYGMSKQVLSNGGSDPSTINNLLSGTADSFVLAAFPSSASTLVYALTAIGGLPDPTRWYLSPVLHTPAFLDSIPRGLLDGARGVSPGTVAGAADFRAAFLARWQDAALDDAFPFYDGGALAILAIARAIAKEGAVPGGAGLAPHVVAVTKPGGTPVRWNDLGRGIALLRDGTEIEYFGLSGQLQFDSNGKTRGTPTSWWNIGQGAFQDVQQNSDCDQVD
jgi:branched-chain amino acid transport system substrate-binding protein